MHSHTHTHSLTFWYLLLPLLFLQGFTCTLSVLLSKYSGNPLVTSLRWRTGTLSWSFAVHTRLVFLLPSQALSLSPHPQACVFTPKPAWSLKTKPSRAGPCDVPLSQGEPRAGCSAGPASSLSPAPRMFQHLAGSFSTRAVTLPASLQQFALPAVVALLSFFT